MTSKNSKFPGSVIRFYRNPEYALDVIGRLQITFVHRSTLNDPFDPYMHFNTEFKDNLNEVDKYIAKNHPGLYKLFKKNNGKYALKKTLQSLNDHFSKKMDSAFIFSASAEKRDSHPRDNLYMWGHYGDGHRGVAIEFSTDEVASCFFEQKMLKSNDADNIWIEMQYMQDAPVISTSTFVRSVLFGVDDQEAENEFKNFIKTTLSAKHSVWSPENEWRMLWHNDETRLKYLHKKITGKCIKAVYFGVNTAKQVEDNFVFELKNNSIETKAFKAEIKKTRFALDFRPL
jgi:hypothetical protein